ncbi:hypothetical protein L6164_013776 [Bauhinia variegata]|uniref:Uncharacterized protein n=1 Tax=Bauhinia variegata TaxID=167791 RepID=A0ACB9NF46_BAUVA|nr:hypothetical protein L6164_013776 [Bauhinia variegata]
MLKNCYDAVPQDGKVIVVETILPVLCETNAAAKNNLQLDIESMVNVGEKERTEQEFRVGNSNWIKLKRLGLLNFQKKRKGRQV